MKVAIVTDSLTNLTSVDLERYPDVYYGYLNVIVDGKAYVEQKEINNDRLFRMIDEGANYSHITTSTGGVCSVIHRLN